MDYDILNAAIEDIVYIVNNYNKDKGYDFETCERLVIALTGYYLAFGPQIFNKLSIVLDALKIHSFETEKACLDMKRQLAPHEKQCEANPCMMWKHIFKGENNEFIGAIPHIIFYKQDLVTDSFSLIHELSHTLEGVTALVTGEDEKYLKIKLGFSDETVDKNRAVSCITGQAMTELITVAVENKILREFMKVKPQEVSNPIVTDFLKKIQSNKGKNIVTKSYPTLTALFKDFIDNETVFDLISMYYYETQPEIFTKEFDSLDERLDFKRLRTYAEHVCMSSSSEVLYYAGPIQKQLNVLNKATGHTPEKTIILAI